MDDVRTLMHNIILNQCDLASAHPPLHETDLRATAYLPAIIAQNCQPVLEVSTLMSCDCKLNAVLGKIHQFMTLRETAAKAPPP